MAVEAPQTYTISTGSTRLVRVNYTKRLDSDVSLSGTPTIAEVTTTDLTLASKAVNTATYVDANTGKTVAVGKAVRFTIAGGASGHSYTVRVTVATDSTPTETLVDDLVITWE